MGATKPKTKQSNVPAWTRFVVAGCGGFSGWLFVHPMDVIKVQSQLIGETLKPGDPRPSIMSVVEARPWGKVAAVVTPSVHRIGRADHNRLRVPRGRVRVPQTRRTRPPPIEDGERRYRPDQVRAFGVACCLQRVRRARGFIGLYDGLSAAAMRQFSYGTLRIGFYDIFSERLLEPGDTSFFSKALVACLSGGLGSFLSNPVEVALVRMQADSRLPAAEQRGYKNGPGSRRPRARRWSRGPRP